MTKRPGRGVGSGSGVFEKPRASRPGPGSPTIITRRERVNQHEGGHGLDMDAQIAGLENARSDFVGRAPGSRFRHAR